MLFLLLSCGDSATDDRPSSDGITTDSGSSSDDTSPPVEGEVTVTIGASGGLVEHPGGASVEVPPGALEGDVEISIRLLDDGEVELPDEDVATEAWEFGPDGTVFSEAVTVTLPITAELGEDEDVLLATWDDEVEGWVVVELEDEDDDHTANTHVYDPDAATISAQTSHFSAFLGGSNALTNLTTYTSGEFSIAAYDTSCSGGAFFTPNNNRPLRTEDVETVVVHSTASTLRNNSTQAAACFMSSKPATAHYLIGRDGRIVDLWDPEDYDVAHVASRVDCTGGSSTTYPTSQKVREFAAGIELHNSEPNFTQAYSGAQMGSLIQLVEYLWDRFDLERPEYPRDLNVSTTSIAPDNTWNAHTASAMVYHYDLDGCRSASPKACPGSAHIDPVGDFRKEAFERALFLDFDGEIDVSGGDAYGANEPGDAGTILIEESPVSVSRQGSHLEVSSAGASISGTQSYDDVVVNGTLTLTSDTTLNVYGTLFVAEGGVIEGPGHDLTINAGGLVVVHGRIDLSGTDGYLPDDGDWDAGGDWAACSYEVTAGVEGQGDPGGDFTLNVGAGPIYVPTLLAMGGDAYEYDPQVIDVVGGDGGDISISVQDARVYLRGGEPRPLSMVLASQSRTMRPEGCESNSGDILQPDDNLVRRGIVSSGGAGPRSTWGGSEADLWGYGGVGGNGGDVTLVASGSGRFIFREVDIWTGSGFNHVVATPFIRDLSNVALYASPLGGTGGRGNAGYTNSAGDGGDGGGAGDVTISGASNATGSPSTSSLIGWDGENPNYVPLTSSGESTLGTLSTWTVDGEVVLRVAAGGGSGGTPGGSADYYGWPGWFGFAGGEGTLSGP